MKKYICPTIEIVELQSKENMAFNPLDAAATIDATGKLTTTYNLAALGASSFEPA